MKLNIARSLTLFGAVVCLGMITSIGIQTYAFMKLKVNGNSYQQIVYGKDLVADILPPPLYVVESYSLALEAAEHPELAQQNFKRIEEVLKPAYDDRRAYWSNTDLAPHLKQKLLTDIVNTGDIFWTVLTGEIKPALMGGTDAGPAFDDLHKAFHDHDKVVNELVAMAVQFQTESEATAAEQTAFFTSLSMGAAALSVAILFGGLYWMRRRAVVPLSQMRDYMTDLAGGDYTKPVPYEGRADEIGEMAHAVTVFREASLDRQMNRQRQEEERNRQIEHERRQIEEKAAEDAERARVIAELSGGLEKLARGDLTFRMTTPFAAAYEKLRGEFNASVETLAGTLGEISTATSTVRNGSAEIATSTDDLAKRTETQAASLEQAAAALDEITATVKNASDRARQASDMMGRTKESAARSAAVVGDAVSAMGKIEDSSSKIGQIIGVIDEIAFQTNLLALNAGVEAARAGEAGKGFAVVAQEVRELAGRSANAAKEIKELVETSSSQVAAGVSLVSRTGDALAEIDGQVKEVNGLIEFIVQSSSEQSSALNEVNAAINQMDQLTQQNAAMVEETNASCRELSDEAVHLNSLLTRFQLDGRLVSGVGSARSAAVNAPPVKIHQAGPATAPVVSPARALGQKLAGALGMGGAGSAATANWEEF
ncbi:HAMP domain-containing protein [Ciceribacter sp. L1K23]|uniref:methyl-accepting chemotaxis protein n=1 Tax=Ciceribacter sp. L1K23 TaxID=2820276 RepID=UPI001B835E80|nr:methyl-accepting chemotaxis protein [Ciceribacter sp. L1K23]MBR0555640.1 HAMP domain-containing protein [Ciceribacter sp. L1K23]